MKKLFALFCLFCMISQSAVAKYSPPKIYGMQENDFILDQMLPNPVVYLYGKDSNGYPILLMNFSATIPFYGIKPDRKRLKFLTRFDYMPFRRKKISSLKFVAMYLKIVSSNNSNVAQNYYYKILKITCEEKSQTIKYEDENKLTVKIEPEYSGMKGGSITDEFRRKANYDSTLPIITYSGVGSDTLKIMLKKGRKYPIPAGHVNVSMVVLAVPYYNPPLNYCTIPLQNFVCDFMNQKNKDWDKEFKIRSIVFGKAYTDNKMRGYYEATPESNPNGLFLDSEIVVGSKQNGVNKCIRTDNATIPDDRFMDNAILKEPSASDEKSTEVYNISVKKKN